MLKVFIGSIMKDEAPYILEWVAYHKALGFELIIADNGGKDNTSEILTALDEAGIISRIDFRFKKYSPQMPAYRAIIRKAKLLNADILGLMDTDEFFTKDLPVSALTPDVGAKYIASEFNRLNANQIGYNWICYGSTTSYEDISKPCLARFSNHSTEDPNVKSFAKLNALKFNILYLGPKVISAHYFCTNSDHHYIGRNQLSVVEENMFRNIVKTQKSYEHGTILHYAIKTKDEFIKRNQRGDVAFKTNKYNDAYFKKYDFKEKQTIIDEKIINQLESYIEDIKKQIDIKAVTKQSLLSILKSKILSFGISPISGYKAAIKRWKQSKFK